MQTVTVKIKLPDYNRKAFTDLLIEGKEIVPFHNYDLLIDHQFFYSHESDVEELLNERLDQEWRKRKYESAVYQEEYWKEYFLEEENGILSIIPISLSHPKRSIRASDV